MHAVAWTLSGGVFDLLRLQSQLQELEEKTAQPDFWNEPQRAQELLKKASRIKDRINPFLELERRLNDVLEFRELLELEPNEELEKETDIATLKAMADLDQLELQAMLSGEHDSRHALVELSAGAGAVGWAGGCGRCVRRRRGGRRADRQW